MTLRNRANNIDTTILKIQMLLASVRTVEDVKETFRPRENERLAIEMEELAYMLLTTAIEVREHTEKKKAAPKKTAKRKFNRYEFPLMYIKDQDLLVPFGVEEGWTPVSE